MAKRYLLILILIGSPLYGSVHQMTVTEKSKVPFSRWFFGDRKVKAPMLLRDIEHARSIGNYRRCFDLTDRALKKNKLMRPWLLAKKMECLRPLRNGKFVARARKVLKTVFNEEEWGFQKPYDEEVFARALSLLIELFKEEAKSNSSKTHSRFLQIEAYKSQLSSQEMALIYKFYGEYLLRQQTIKAAIPVLEKSLLLNPDDKLWKKVRRLKKDPQAEKVEEPGPASVFLEEKETELIARFRRAIASEDYLAAVEDGVELLQKFPGGENADSVAATLRDLYLQLLLDPQLEELAEDVVDKIRRSPAPFLVSWGRFFFEKGYFESSKKLLERAGAALTNSSESFATRFLLGRACQLSGDYSAAISQFEFIVEKAAGKKVAIDALFHSALSHLREGDNSKAISQFERLLQTKGSEDYHVATHYWLWRVLGLVNQQRAETHQKSLVEKFPFSYYGLIALAERHEGILKLFSEKSVKKFKAVWNLTTPDYLHWKRANQLLEAGWLKAGRAELAQLGVPSRVEQKVGLARYWASAMGYDKAMRLLDEAWSSDPSFQTKNVVSIVFPQEFKDEVLVHARIYSLRPEFLWGVIREESAFSVDRREIDGRQGLMQVPVAEAEEIGKALAVSNIKLPEDLSLPLLNIRFGAYSLAKKIRYYQGHAGLGWISYKLGQGKSDLFLGSRKWNAESLKKDPSYLAGMWVDELPWQEAKASFKRVFASSMIYQALYQENLTVNPPYWAAMDSKAEKSPDSAAEKEGE